MSDQGTVLPGCKALSAYASGKRLTTALTRQAVFSKDLSRLLLSTFKSGSSYDDLTYVELPAGKTKLLASGIVLARFLGTGQQAVLAARPTKTLSSPYDLLLIRPGSGSAGTGSVTTLATSVLGHKATPDGSRVYVVLGGTSGPDTLAVVNVQTGAATVLDKDVSYYSLAVSADSKYMAYVGSTTSSGCPNTGTSYVVDSAGTKQTLAPLTRVYGMEFLLSGKLLLQVLTSCSGQTQLKLASPASGALTLLAQGLDYSYGGLAADEPFYVTTSDLKRVMGAEMSTSVSAYKLLSVRTDGSGSQVLASDLYPYMTISMAYMPWRLTADDKHVVYTPTTSSKSTMGLSAVPLAGGKARTLTPSLWSGTFQISTRADEVAFVTYLSSGRQQVRLASASTGQSQLLLETQQSVSNLRVVKGGRGLLLVESLPGGATLRYLPRQGTGSTALATWNMSNLSGGYVMDSSGCALVYCLNAGSGSGEGTYLRLIPR